MLRRAAMVLVLVGAGGCFTDVSGEGGGSSGSSSTTDQTVLPPIDLFSFACDDRTTWQTGPLDDLLLTDCTDVLPPDELGGVRTHSSVVVQDGNGVAKAIEVTPFPVIGGVTVGRIAEISISAFEEPVLATEIACGADSPTCDFAWSLAVFEPGVPELEDLASDAGDHNPLLPISTKQVSLAEVTVDLVDVELAVFSTGEADPSDRAFFIELRIEEAP